MRSLRCQFGVGVQPLRRKLLEPLTWAGCERLDPPKGGLRQSRHLVDDPAVNRSLVSCGLVDPDTFRVEASDGTVWLHHVERDEQSKPMPGQIDGWLNLICAPPGIDEVLSVGLGSNQRTVVIPGARNRG